MRLLKKLGVSILGPAVILVGVALLVLPGPGLLVIAAGVAILATEYTWARRLLEPVKRWMQRHRQSDKNDD